MTYSSGSLIQATDYNGFVSTTAGANINATWGSAFYGQSNLATVAAAGTVSATQWATLVNTLSSLGSHTNTALTARSAPTAGQTIGILSAVNTDITNVYNNRFNAYAVGTQYTAWTGTNSKTAATGAGSWTITITNTVTWASSGAAQYFFNAGGLIKITCSKTSTGQVGDPPWNALATAVGDIYVSGTAGAHTIAGTSYTGITKVGGSGTPTTLATSQGWDGLSAGAAATIVMKQFSPTAPYTGDYIQHTLAKNAGSTALTISTTWVGVDGDPISGGTAASGATPGTAPCTIVTYFPPESTYLTNTWGTPTVAATTA
jgi:hypothetical protein